MKHTKILTYLFFLLLNVNVDVKTQPLPIVSGIYVGHIVLANPIVTLLGGTTLALSIIAHNAYQTYKHKECLCSEDITEALAERSYYEERKKKLLALRNEFLAVKCGIEAIQGLQRMGSTSFTQQFLKKHSYDSIKFKHDISKTEEKRLSDEQKEVLRKARETELASLEKQIGNIQLILVLHVNQLITNLNHAQQAYDAEKPRIYQIVANTWDQSAKLVDTKAKLLSYKMLLLEYWLIKGIRKALDELKLVAAYYNVCTNECIKKTTTICTFLNQIVPFMNERSVWIENQEKQIQHNITIAEQYFIKYAISFAQVKYEAQKTFDNGKKERAAQVLSSLEKELVHHSSSGGLKKMIIKKIRKF